MVTETHYAAVATMKDREQFQGDQPTDSEAADAFRSIRLTHAGAYTVSGSTITATSMVSPSPGLNDTSRDFGFRLDGDDLIAWLMQLDGTKGDEYTFRRVN